MACADCVQTPTEKKKNLEIAKQNAKAKAISEQQSLAICEDPAGDYYTIAATEACNGGHIIRDIVSYVQ